MRIAVTGALGFLGQALCADLLLLRYSVRGVIRSRDSLSQGSTDGLETIAVGDIGSTTDWSSALPSVGRVIHCAARAHVMHKTEADAISAYRAVNVEGTLNLARQAAALGVKRFVFLSSIKVNGENTKSGEPFKAADTLNPQDTYGASKMEAERGLYEVSRDTGMEVVCIRPPLVYGPGVKGNFLSLLRWLDRGLPLPLGAIRNRRSLVGLDNLIDLIIICLDHPAAANQTFLVSDDDDLSTTELLRRMAIALERSVRLLPVPSALLELGARLLGKKDVAQRLLDNLQVDISKTKKLLGWSPPVSIDEG